MSDDPRPVPIRIYLDACCLCRVFDDQTQRMVFAEAEAVRRLLEGVHLGRWELVSSDVLELEPARMPDPQRRLFVLG